MIAGVDEAGRGALAGNVVAGAIIFDPAMPLPGLRDSKLLSSAQRDRLFDALVAGALAWSFGVASAAEIDQLNILQATLLAMRRAVAGLWLQPTLLWVDGVQAPDVKMPVRTFVGGDRRFALISAASIIAKVVRDRQMDQLDLHYTPYGFARHKGYPTASHLQALAQYGITPWHRLSFKPVRAYG